MKKKKKTRVKPENESRLEKIKVSFWDFSKPLRPPTADELKS